MQVNAVIVGTRPFHPLADAAVPGRGRGGWGLGLVVLGVLHVDSSRMQEF
jgi:hypothetical protein